MIIILGCGNDKMFIPITFVYENPLTEPKYPDYVKEIAEPYSTKCGDSKFDVLFKPSLSQHAEKPSFYMHLF